MKVFFLFFFSAFLNVLSAQKFDKLSDYNNFFVVEFNNVQKHNLQYMAICVHGTDEEIIQACKKLLNVTT